MTNNFTITHPILKSKPAQQPSDNKAREIDTCTNPGNCTQHGWGKGEENRSTETEAGNCTHGRRHTTRNKYQCTTTLKHACMSTPAPVQRATHIPKGHFCSIYMCTHLPREKGALLWWKRKRNVLRFSHKAKSQEPAEIQWNRCTCWYMLTNRGIHSCKHAMAYTNADPSGRRHCRPPSLVSTTQSGIIEEGMCSGISKTCLWKSSSKSAQLFRN